MPTFVCLAYEDTTQLSIPVPVNVDCSEVDSSTGQFELKIPDTLKDKDFALLFYGENGLMSPEGYAGESGKAYLLHFDGDTTLNVTLQQDSNGALIGDVDQQSLIDGESANFVNYLNPDYIDQTYSRMEVIDVGRARKEQGLLIDDRPEDDNLKDTDGYNGDESYYYFWTYNDALPECRNPYDGSMVAGIWGDDNNNKDYMVETDADGNFTNYYYSVPSTRLTILPTKIPVWVSKVDEAGNPYDWETVQKLIANVKYAINEWNELFREVLGQDYGFVFMGMEPPLKGNTNPTPFTVEFKLSTFLPAQPGIVVVPSNVFDSNTYYIGRTYFNNGAMRNVTVKATYTVQTTEGTKTSTYYWLLGYGSALIAVRPSAVDNIKVVAHEFGHYLHFDHPFQLGMGDIPSIMNYDTNGTDTLSDFDKKIFKDVWGLLNTQYGIKTDSDFQTEVQKWFDDYAPAEIYQSL